MPSSSSLLKQDNEAKYSSTSEKNLPQGKLDGKPLPSNIDAEQGLLAACILDLSLIHI